MTAAVFSKALGYKAKPVSVARANTQHVLIEKPAQQNAPTASAFTTMEIETSGIGRRRCCCYRAGALG